MNKHTPGPWYADGAGILYAAPSEADEFEVIEINAPYNSQDRYLIAQVHAGFTQSQANAHLIAAAPAMYEALEHAAMSCHHPACKCKGEYASQPERYCTCHVQKARQALAQAEGK